MHESTHVTVLSDWRLLLAVPSCADPDPLRRRESGPRGRCGGCGEPSGSLDGQLDCCTARHGTAIDRLTLTAARCCCCCCSLNPQLAVCHAHQRRADRPALSDRLVAQRASARLADMAALEHSAINQPAATEIDQPDSTETMQLLVRPLQILLAALLVYFVRMLWRHWLESMRPTVHQYRHRHEGAYNVPHTVVRWSDKRVARTSAPEDDADGDCSGGVHDGLYPGESRCAFLDEHKDTFDPSVALKSDSASKSSSTVQLRTYSVQPHPRIGNGFSDPHRVRALLIWVGDVPVGARHAAHLAHRCAGMGVAFRSMDHRGFGESEGPAGTVDLWQRMVDDQAAFVAHAYNQQTAQNADEASAGATPLPLFLGGMGFGATIALLLATRMGPSRVAGLLLLSPAIQLGISPRLQSIAKTLVGLLSRQGPLGFQTGRVSSHPSLSLTPLLVDLLCVPSGSADAVAALRASDGD